ncbi:hypothetical protein TWF718_005921 [Orbilia javanica]|uniref:Uncharacterized protein n=1 Tax=Orbilia javanica TaxID=47235 RepID=A0AAN8N2B4_9PEZI
MWTYPLRSGKRRVITRPVLETADLAAKVYAIWLDLEAKYLITEASQREGNLNEFSISQSYDIGPD